MFDAEFNHCPVAFAGEPRLETTRFVINAGVNDPAVVSGLMASEGTLFLENSNALSRILAHCRERSRETYDASANDDEIKLTVHGVDNTMAE